MRSHLVPKLFDRENGFVPAVARNKIFGLQLGATAGRELHTEMRQSLMPGAGNTHLLSTTFRRMPRHRVKLLGCKLRPIKLRRELE